MSRLLFEIFDKMRRVSKAQMVGNFGNAPIGMEQIALCFQNELLPNQVAEHDLPLTRRQIMFSRFQPTERKPL